MVVCNELYRRFPEYLEGELTKIKSAVVSRRICAEMSRELGLPRFLFIGKGMNGRTALPHSLAAAVYESLIAAIYPRQQQSRCTRSSSCAPPPPHIDAAAESEHQRNFKSQLQQHAQKALRHAHLRVAGREGPRSQQMLRGGRGDQGQSYGSAWGPSKKEAEQKAAYLALRELGVVKLHPEFEAEGSPGGAAGNRCDVRRQAPSPGPVFEDLRCTVPS